jgi:hypothetical protein
MSEMVRFVPFVKLVLNNLNKYAILFAIETCEKAEGL